LKCPEFTSTGHILTENSEANASRDPLDPQNTPGMVNYNIIH